VSAVTSSSDSDGESTESAVLDDSQLVTTSSNSNSNISSFLSAPSNSSSSTAASCSCTSFLFHSLLCPVPISRRLSLYFTSPSSVLPRNQHSFNIEYIMSQRVTSLSDASDAQKQLIK